MSRSTEKRLTVILGAGASHDCIDREKTAHDDKYHSPLVRDLFGTSRKFATILGKYPGAEALSDEIRTEIARGKTLETVLRVLSYSAEVKRECDLVTPLAPSVRLQDQSERFEPVVFELMVNSSRTASHSRTPRSEAGSCAPSPSPPGTRRPPPASPPSA